MSKKPHRPVNDSDWNQLITLASGYLALEQGDVHAAMSRALAAHVKLISALKAETISAEVAEGRVTMFVPEGGGVALRLDPHPKVDPVDAAAPTPAPTSTYMMEEDD